MDNYTTEIKQSDRGFRNGKNKGMLNIGYFLLMDRQQERVASLWLLPFIRFVLLACCGGFTFLVYC